MKIDVVKCVALILLLYWGGVCTSAGYSEEKSTSKEDSPDKTKAIVASMMAYREHVVPLFKKHCQRCHGEKLQEGELELLKLDPNMKSTSAARWAMVLEKVVGKEMPPEEEPQLSGEELKSLVTWIQAEMKRTGKHLARRATYKNGNRIPHELLFGGKSAAAFSSPVRIRRVSPEIYEAFTRDVGKGAVGIGQPFSPEGNNTFKDMGAPLIDEPITQQLIRNALQIVKKQTGHKIEKGVAIKVGFTPKEFLRLFDEKNPASNAEVESAIKQQFGRVLRREPTTEELKKFVTLFHKNVKEAGRKTGVRYTLAAVFLLPEAVFRWEVGNGIKDSQGRVRLTPREIAYALSFALTDKMPNGSLLKDAESGKLDTKEGVAAAIHHILDNPKTQKPRILRFFREYFGYARALEVFKEQKANPEHDAKILVEDTDRLIEYILEKDENVLYELLTTNKSFVAHRIAADTKKKREAERIKFEKEKKKNPEKYKNKTPRKIGRSVYESYNLEDFPDKQPVELPKDQRAGILTQPSWLVAWSNSDENHVIFRGKWIRERLLGGVVPDVPITVDAQLPNAPEQTLRERMKVTEQTYCWKCHTYMNRVGLPFEQYDHLGRFRKTETVLDLDATEKNVDKKGKHLGPVMKEVALDTSGGFEHTNEPNLKGDVSDPLELVRKMAASERVEQIFVRHAFRYWMGRNENLGDAISLQEAHKAYKANKGSMKALIVAILTSDSFLHRIPFDSENEESSSQSSR